MIPAAADERHAVGGSRFTREATSGIVRSEVRVDVTVRDRHDPRRCAFCHDALELSPARVAGCGRCGALTHLACWSEHGGCPVFGCAPASTDAGPRVVAWSEFVSEADAWLALGAALDERAWGSDSPVVDDGHGSESTFTSSQAA